MNLERRVLAALADLGVDPSETVGVATSGGADSMALLGILAAQRGEGLHVLHVDHGLRPDSDLDAAFVDQIAKRLGLDCTVMRRRATVARGDSVEAAARRVRYEALEAAAVSLGLPWVATAHTLDDQAETVLLRAMRGSPVAGIAPVRGIFVRPMLDVTGAELREWLRARGIAWREDPTNADTRFERNWVRHELMPMLAVRRPGVAKALARSGTLARGDEAVLDALAEDVVSRAEVDDVGVLLRADDLAPLPVAIASRVVRKAFRWVGEEASADATNDVLGLGPRGRVRSGSVLVHRIPEGFAFVRADGVDLEPLRLREGRFESPAWAVTLRLGAPAAPAWTWRTRVPDACDVAIRSRRPGDRVPTPGGTRKVQDVLVDAKVPLPLRDLVPIVIADDEPVAVVGLTCLDSGGGRTPTTVLDVEPLEPTWSRAILWNRAGA